MPCKHEKQKHKKRPGGYAKTAYSPGRCVFMKFLYRSSLKYGRPREAGGWFSRLLRMEVSTSTTMVTT